MDTHIGIVQYYNNRITFTLFCCFHEIHENTIQCITFITSKRVFSDWCFSAYIPENVEKIVNLEIIKLRKMENNQKTRGVLFSRKNRKNIVETCKC